MSEETKLDVYYHKKNLVKLVDELELYTPEEYRRFLSALIRVSLPFNERFIPDDNTHYQHVAEAIGEINEQLGELKSVDGGDAFLASLIIKRLTKIKKLLEVKGG